MEPGQYSRTALVTAFIRAQHQRDAAPRVLEDPFAERLLTAGESKAIAARWVQEGQALGLEGMEPREIVRRVLRAAKPGAFVLARARYTEDRLALAMARGVDQYVLVGAGLDSFAFRRAELRERLRVFELDHPQSQAAKRARIAAAGLAEPGNLHFGAVDFEHENVATALRRLPFDADRPAVFAWLGVTMYLTRAAIDETWRALRTVAAPGSELVFDFVHPDAFADTAPAGVRRMRERTRAIGEAMVTGLDPGHLDADLAATGWTLVERVDGDEIRRRWFASPDDGWLVGALGSVACAQVR